ncbi:farnesyl-diphosphate farnesyltransferase [Polytolypa hystricis UAMH7299]|uniref:Squalene synthase n=1 Tax=Polytolypa hystricis (strain UAMH7299) TaxID=1447883 RepID=A0A2B7X0J8_POLH7|nr:farnesyl-diphosphate farnesyltransferase [Polytolypa hystricis UAMH7299]
MVNFSSAIYHMFHPQELRAIVQWKIWHNPVHERKVLKETETEKKCFEFLTKTSRSFSAVILELHPELLMPVCLFYLILRGLDTIEDDTSIPLSTKEPLLRDFDNVLEQDGWTFDGNRPEEKDRELLVQFHYVVTEFKKVNPAYKDIIKDITKKMGNGMADYCRRAELEGDNKVNSVEDYDLYCYYVAGLVGEGLTRLFVEAGFANPKLLERPNLYNSMGLFLQKTNIIRDIKEDTVDNRRFWPKAIWSKHVDQWEDLFKPENREAALNCNSEMILNALDHADECMFYLAGLREQSIFNFCAIPQSMAIATLELCFRNPAMFERNVKITKGTACQLMNESTQNVKTAYEIFRKYTNRIHCKNTPKDPNFLNISVACGKVETFIQSVFPSQTADEANKRVTGEMTAEQRAKLHEASEAKSDVLYLFFSVFGVLFLISLLMIGTAWLFGARFDLAYKEVLSGNFFPKQSLAPSPSAIHGEL